MRYFCWLFVCLAAGHAQDLFEIHVYEPELVPAGQFTYEANVTYASGGTSPLDPLLCRSGQLYFTSEFTAALTDSISVGAAILTTRPSGTGFDVAGFRFLTELFAPPSWRLPVGLGVVTEASFQKSRYSDSPAEIELRPVIEKRLRRLDWDVNPAFSHSLLGAGEWTFEPAARIGWRWSKMLTPSLEYYGFWNSSHETLRSGSVQWFFPGMDVKLRDHLTWNVGFSAGPSRDLILKTRVTLEFGK